MEMNSWYVALRRTLVEIVAVLGVAFPVSDAVNVFQHKRSLPLSGYLIWLLLVALALWATHSFIRPGRVWIGGFALLCTFFMFQAVSLSIALMLVMMSCHYLDIRQA